MADEDVRAELLSLQRLEGEFARHRLEFQRTRDEVLGLSGEFSNLKASVQGNIADLRASVNAVGAKLDERSKLNLPAIGLAVAMIPAVWLFVTTYTQSVVAPVMSMSAVNSKTTEVQGTTIADLQQKTSSSISADVASRTDRTQLNERTRLLETGLDKEVADRRTISAQTTTQLAEIETQFHAVSDLDNLRTIWQHRINSLLWEKANPGEHYPGDSFFPTSIFHDSSKSIGGSGQ